jgi:hypothetical protein
MPREQALPSSALIRKQDLQAAANPGFIDDIVRELQEVE